MLTDVLIKGIKSGARVQKHFDGGGLFLFVSTSGSRIWRLKYRFNGREKLYVIGNYPLVSLKEARQKRDDLKRLIADGIDPNAKRKAERDSVADTFQAIAQEWLQMQNFKPATKEKAEWTFNDLIFPYIGNEPIRSIKPSDILSLLRRLESRGKNETAHRTKQRCGQVFRYAIATGRAENDPTQALRGALAPVKTRNHAALTDPRDISALLKAIDAYSGHATTEIALKLAPMLFVRPGELRKAEWREFFLEGPEPEWRIPAAKMKMAQEHVVPLPRQAVRLLLELRRSAMRLGEASGYVFPATTDPNKPMSECTLTSALRRMGYTREQMTWHGFRTMASTRLNELDWNADVIELQLAHQERNKVRAAYNKAQRLRHRREMMQYWADELDRLKLELVARAA